MEDCNNGCGARSARKQADDKKAAAFRPGDAQATMVRDPSTPQGDDSDACSNASGVSCAVYQTGMDPRIADRRMRAIESTPLTLTGGQIVRRKNKAGIVVQTGRRWLLGVPRALRLSLDDIKIAVVGGGEAPAGTQATLRRTLVRNKPAIGWRNYMLPAKGAALGRLAITDGHCMCDHLEEAGQPVLSVDPSIGGNNDFREGGLVFTAWILGEDDPPEVVVTAHAKAIEWLPEPVDCNPYEDPTGYKELLCADYVPLGEELDEECAEPEPEPEPLPDP